MHRHGEASGPAGADSGFGAPIEAVEGAEHRIGSGPDALFLWEKRARGAAKGIVLCVHGSSASSLPTFDLKMPGKPEVSMMNWLASRGFDVWCFDCRGYGRSYKGPEVWARCAEGAADIAAVADHICRLRGVESLLVYGTSSGALRAAMYASRHPERVKALVLDGMVWTGEGSRTLEERRQKIDLWKSASRRPIDPAFMRSIATRDLVPSADPVLVDLFTDQTLEADSEMPTGTYIDMCENLPLVDPARITMPVLLLRGEFDGVGSLPDTLAFFARLGSPARQLHLMEGMAHATNLQKNYFMSYERVERFFSLAQPAFTGAR